MRLAALLLCCAFAPLGLVACGGEDGRGAAGATTKNTGDPKADGRRISREVQAIGADLGKAVQSADGKTDQQIGAEFGRLADRTDQAVEDLEALKAPARAKATTDGLHDALEQAGKDLRAVADAAKNGDAQKASQATVKLVQNTPTVSEARERFEREVTR